MWSTGILFRSGYQSAGYKKNRFLYGQRQFLCGLDNCWTASFAEKPLLRTLTQKLLRKSFIKNAYAIAPQKPDGVDGLREPKSHAVHNPHTIDPELEIERRIIELRRGHPDCGKKRIARKGERLQVWVCE